MTTRIDLALLEQALRRMKPRSKLYELVRAEVERRGHWKAKPRGKPMSKGYDVRRKGGDAG